MAEATFIVIGDTYEGEKRRRIVGRVPAAAGDTIVFDERLYEESGQPGSPDRNKAVGWAHGVCVLTWSERAMCTIVLHLEQGDSVTASGLLPYEPKVNDVGIRDGVIPVTGGTGRFRASTGELEFSVTNPHKYSVIP